MNYKNLLASVGGTFFAAATGAFTNRIVSDGYDIIDTAIIAAGLAGLATQGAMFYKDVPTHPKVTALATFLKAGATSWFGYVFGSACDNQSSCPSDKSGQIQAVVALSLAAIVTAVEIGFQLTAQRREYQVLN